MDVVGDIYLFGYTDHTTIYIARGFWVCCGRSRVDSVVRGPLSVDRFMYTRFDTFCLGFQHGTEATPA